jgi:hypothetical protein
MIKALKAQLSTIFKNLKQKSKAALISLKPEEKCKVIFRRYQLDYANNPRFSNLEPCLREALFLFDDFDSVSSFYNSNRYEEHSPKSLYNQLLLIIYESIRLCELYDALNKEGYLKVLAKKSKQLVFEDDYGDTDYSAWDAELTRFYEKKFMIELYIEIDKYYLGLTNNDFILCYLGKDGYHKIHNMGNLDEYDKQDALEEVDDQFRTDVVNLTMAYRKDHYLALSFNTNSIDDVQDPYEYEHAVAEIIKGLGWNAKVTKGSGDQGIDVIAEKDGYKVVIQCKLYSKPVGNKAVQEVQAGKGYDSADLGIVVTNSSYTKSAKRLADSLGVFVIHHDYLSETFDRISQNIIIND